MPVAHYFSKDNDQLESDPKRFKCFVGGKEYHFLTDSGVFSRKGLDFGSRLLLETILPNKQQHVLDLGCGYGPIGIVLADQWQSCVTMVDQNKRAIQLAKKNADLNRVQTKTSESDGFSGIDGRFSLIVTNPPIRAGKKTYYSWFAEARNHLEEDGKLIFVIRKDQGALSSIAYCRSLYMQVNTLERKSGYFIISCQKPLTI
jgi:16S rRNA (guanine1207-N2)-methyltransferase